MKNQQKEGELTKKVEKQTAKMPSDIYLGSALVVMGVALVFKLIGKKHESLFVGQWAAPFLLMGLYNKIVKVEGHDKNSSPKN